jgi:hypothetical protein
MGRLVTQALDNDLDQAVLARYGRVNDYAFPMLYDEHYRTSDPGPVASQSWYMERATRSASVGTRSGDSAPKIRRCGAC